MAYPDFAEAFTLHTNASKDGLGPVLYQSQNGVMRVIAYASRTLSPTEKKYHVHAGKLEFLALQWAVTEQFRDYLYYSPKFIVFTENNPLTYILTSAKLNATGLQWVNELADFHFDIKYRPGRTNADADTLSHMPISFEDYMKSSSEVVNQDVLDAVIGSIHKTNTVQTTWLSSLTAVPDRLREECVDIPTMPLQELIAAQQEDRAIARVFRFMKNGRCSHIRKNSTSLPLHDSSYMNGTNCSLLKMESSIIGLDRETEWFYPRNTIKGCMKNCMKTWGTLVQKE